MPRYGSLSEGDIEKWDMAATEAEKPQKSPACFSRGRLSAVKNYIANFSCKGHMTVSRTQTGHIIFGPNFKWKSLTPVFDNILRTFLKETGQMPPEEDIVKMFVRLNMMDLEKNRKPEGWNRRGRIRMVFPISDKPQLYLRSSMKSAELVRMTELLSSMLKKAKITHKIKYDELKYIRS